MLYQLNNFTIDSDRFELRRGAEVVALQPRAMRLLLLLVEADGALVTKAKIQQEIWDGRVVGDNAVSSQVKALRRAFGDSERPHTYIGTVHGEGFRILAPIVKAAEAEAHDGSADDSSEDRIGQKPVVAILPFRQVGLSEATSTLAEALPDDIISALSRMRWLDVIARGSSFRFPSYSVDGATIRQQLGVDYCLSGSIESEGEAFTIRVALEDTRDTTVVWSERYNARLASIHEIREEIVARTVAAVDFHTPLHEMQRTRLLPASRLTAWQAYHHGISNVFTFGRPDYAAAQRHFRHALSIDPDFARAHAGISHVNWWQLIQQNQDIGESARAEMMRTAERAVESDPLDPFANLVRGRAAWLAGDADTGLAWLTRSVTQAPNFAMAHGAIANLHALRGDADAALPHVERAITLSPLDPWLHNILAIRAAAHLVKGEFEEAVAWSDKAMAMPHDSLIVVQCALVAYHLGGRQEDARRVANRLKRAHPDISAANAMRALPVFSDRFEEWVDDAFVAYGLK